MLAIAVVAFLGAMQVIGTQAQGDEGILRELSQQVKVAQVSSGVSGFSVASPLTSGVESSTAAPLESRTGLAFEAPAAAQSFESQPSSDQTRESQQKLAAETSPSPAAAAATANDACVPDAGGAPYCTYVVQDGDTLSAIAQDLGLEGTVAFSAAELIALSNGLNDAQNWLIVVGQELRVPLDSGVIHTVGESESVSVLATLYGVSADEVVAANGLADANSVVIGETLLIPSPSLWPLDGPATAALPPLDPVAPAADEPTETPEDAASAEATAENAALEATPETATTPEAAAALPAPVASANANPSVTEIRDLFAAGYIAAAGPPQYLEYLLDAVISCESGYNLRAFNPAGPFYGLMQFLPLTWANTGGGDWFDPWQQGHNTGVLLQTASPNSQWPVCWY